MLHSQQPTSFNVTVNADTSITDRSPADACKVSRVFQPENTAPRLNVMTGGQKSTGSLDHNAPRRQRRAPKIVHD